MFKDSYLKSLGIMIDFCFFLDMLVAFRTTYIDLRTGLEVSDEKKIAKNYLRG